MFQNVYAFGHPIEHKAVKVKANFDSNESFKIRPLHCFQICSVYCHRRAFFG